MQQSTILDPPFPLLVLGHGPKHQLVGISPEMQQTIHLARQGHIIRPHAFGPTEPPAAPGPDSNY